MLKVQQSIRFRRKVNKSEEKGYYMGPLKVNYSLKADHLLTGRSLDNMCRKVHSGWIVLCCGSQMKSNIFICFL